MAGGIVALLIILTLLVIVICCYTIKGKKEKYNIHSREECSASSSHESLNNPELATPDLCRKASVIEMKPIDLSGLVSSEDKDLIPSRAIPVDKFCEHVEKFGENCRLLFQREFDVSI